MHSFHEALETINSVEFRLPAEEVELTGAWNRILYEEVVSDVNMPPFDKSAMDGYACRKADLNTDLKVIGILEAGSVEWYRIIPGSCVKIMTGAPVPEGADTVIMVEDTRMINSDTIRFTGNSVKKNICGLGEDVRTGEILLKPGELLFPHKIAVLASAGYSRVKVSVKPSVALLSTGSELVSPDQKPGKAQIRNSNAYNLHAQLQQMSIDAHYTGIVPDDKEVIRSKLKQLLNDFDVVILTGGVSMGDHDHVPGILQEQKLEILFDRVAIQPGKPMAFAAGRNKFCFGLSGNPVSSFLQFELLVKPLIYRIMGHAYAHPIVFSELAEPVSRKNAGRLKFLPVRFNAAGQAEEVRFNGSAHIAGLCGADGFGLFPENCEALDAGDKMEVLVIR
jgi:molybdopterin molybdotransferase